MYLSKDSVNCIFVNTTQCVNNRHIEEAGNRASNKAIMRQNQKNVLHFVKSQSKNSEQQICCTEM